MTGIKTISLPMVCICREEYRQDVYARRARVAEILQLDDDQKYWAMSSAIIYALSAWWDPCWEIDSIASDMWMMVSIKQWRGDDRLSVPCDLFEDGLIALFLYVHDNYERAE